MGKSNAERRAAYRARHFKEADGTLTRLNTSLSTQGKAKLERLSSCYRVTQRTIIETLLAQAERSLLNALPSGEQEKYLDRKLSLHGNGDRVTKAA